jgi:hypothetical protein
MAQFDVMVKLVVEADSETDAYLCAEGAAENMVCGAIMDANVHSVDEKVAETA